MKLLFINPSLRPGSAHLFLPVGLAYVMTYVKKHGFNFDLLDVDVDNLTNKQVEQYIQKNKYDVICLGSIVTHYKWMKWCINMIKSHQPDAKIIVGNSMGAVFLKCFLKPHSRHNCLRRSRTYYGRAFECNKENKSLGHPLEPIQKIKHSNKGYPDTVKGEGIKGIIFRHGDLVVNNGKRKAVKNIDEFPFPDWDLFDVQKYLNQGRKHRVNHAWNFKPEDAIVLPINTARGCVLNVLFAIMFFGTILTDTGQQKM